MHFVRRKFETQKKNQDEDMKNLSYILILIKIFDEMSSLNDYITN